MCEFCVVGKEKKNDEARLCSESLHRKAGKHDSGDEIATAVDLADVEAELYGTTGPRDATRFVRQWLGEHPDEEVRFYACGGDGTLNEVVSGLLESGQTSRAEVGCYPCGSGNDFVKSLEVPTGFDIASICMSPSVAIDAIRITTSSSSHPTLHYAINTLNFGFEAAVCRTMGDVRRWPLLGGGMAYVTGIVHSLMHARHHPCTVTVDGALWHEGDLLLLSLANGQWAGSGFHCAPRADLADGLIEVMAVTPLSIPRFARLIKYYKNGELLDREEMRGIVHYIRGQRVTIEAKSHAFIAADGEVFYGNHFDIECLPQALRFISTQNSEIKKQK